MNLEEEEGEEDNGGVRKYVKRNDKKRSAIKNSILEE